MQITDKKYFEQYQSLIGSKIKNLVANFDFKKNDNVLYQTQASAVYSSNIEGNSIDLNSFMNYKMSLQKATPKKELKEIEDLVDAYKFAQENNLNEKNFLQTHKILTENILIKKLRGKYRNDKVGVFGESGLVYLAVEPEFVEEAMKQFFVGIKSLLLHSVSIEEAFYYASLIHLRFVHIHPFRDGNGRAARLLEKWFLTQKLGSEFWKIPIEKYYKEHLTTYYSNINLGVNYYELNYDKCLPFLTMLPNSLM